ncbi:hypothetical protein [Bdellovibrio bacteriovorus]|uniref:hypothetical protein n=1 Tax=Bdellovibrio bacteriovorus TaxID=959 RepID=UPI0035A60FCD
MMIFGILLASVLGGLATFFLVHRARVSTVRASSGVSLIFSLLVSLLPVPFVGALQASFFGATFVGMTDSSRMGWKRVLLASLLFGLIFVFLVPLAKGIGGGLGAAAFVSSSAIYFVDRLVRKRFRKP